MKTVTISQCYIVLSRANCAGVDHRTNVLQKRLSSCCSSIFAADLKPKAATDSGASADEDGFGFYDNASDESMSSDDDDDSETSHGSVFSALGVCPDDSARLRSVRFALFIHVFVTASANFILGDWMCKLMMSDTASDQAADSVVVPAEELPSLEVVGRALKYERLTCCLK